VNDSGPAGTDTRIPANEKRLELADIQELTIAYGDGWGYPHACRVLRLSEEISGGLQYDHEAFAFAVFLHDWGAFSRFSQAGGEHALRSREIAAGEILPQTVLSERRKIAILEAIELHDFRDPRPAPTPEATLLREADFLDFLGAIGLAREFTWGQKDLRASYERIRRKKEMLRERFTLPVARQMAAERIERMEGILQMIEAESFGFL
jgi:uncharacterized protein